MQIDLAPQKARDRGECQEFLRDLFPKMLEHARTIQTLSKPEEIKRYSIII